MKRGKQIDTWYPMYIDKWLFGSTRHELILHEGESWVDLRGIFQDLLALSKKDGGFIRANETTPYPIEQLAGMFCVPQEYLKKTLELCQKYLKISEPIPGIYYINSTETYNLSDRWKSAVSKKAAECSETSEVRLKEIKEDNTFPQSSFEVFWAKYPRRIGKQDAVSALKAALKAASIEEILAAVDGYKAEIESKRTAEEYIKYPSTFLRKDRWRDYLAKPKMTAAEFKAQHEAEMKNLRERG